VADHAARAPSGRGGEHDPGRESDPGDRPMSDDDPNVCFQVLYTGRVQGVGFRWTTAEIATRFAVEGYVKNLSNGSVELVAQGKKSVVREFLDAVLARFRSHVRDLQENSAPPQPDLRGFAIRR
jgi:acylphosphatase